MLFSGRLKNTQIKLRQPDLTFPKIWTSWQIMMYTSQELMIYDIGYKTLRKFWSVKRMVYVIHIGLYTTDKHR